MKRNSGRPKPHLELPEDRGARAAEADLREFARERAEMDARSQPTATERINALNARAAANNGLVVDPPETLTAAAFRAWLHAVAEVGSPGHVEIAWHHCQNAQIKEQFWNEYDALRDQAGRRYSQLQAEAAREQEAERAASARRAERARLERLRAEHLAAAAAISDKLKHI
jgi:hypothetical protein